MPADYSSSLRHQPNSWINLHSPLPVQWNRVTLACRGLPGLLDGLRLLHITDPHFRSIWCQGWSRLAGRISTANADLILMTGDFVDSKVDAGPAIRPARKFFSALRSKAGNYAIFGNHDHDLLYRLARQAATEGLIPPEPWPRRRADADHEPTGMAIPPALPALSLFGQTLLDDRREVIKYNDAEIELIGLRGTSRADFNHEFVRSIQPKVANRLRIVLLHHPDGVRRIESLQADLILCGHTHGGQICLPGQHPIITHDTLPRKYVSGIHRWKDSWLVISRGLGYSSYPVRTFCPPEVVEITITG